MEASLSLVAELVDGLGFRVGARLSLELSEGSAVRRREASAAASWDAVEVVIIESAEWIAFGMSLAEPVD